MSKGFIFACLGYFLWGILPLYWKIIQEVPAFQIMCHRIVWSVVFLLLIHAIKGNFSWLKKAFQNKKVLLTFLTSALLLSANWFTYIWSVNNGRTIEASLGYFINPLFMVILGVIFLKERPDKWSWFAIGLAAVGIVYTITIYGSVPWVAFVLVGSFGTYGLLRKTAALNSLQGLTLETILMLIPALVFLIYFEINGTGAFGHLTFGKNVLLAMAGIATSVPLLFFAYGARRIQYTTTGILQYIAPTFQFIIGLLIFKEEFTTNRLIGFSFVWLALIIYTVNNVRKRRRSL
ncbi:MAG: EamA family transporter RarD [Candidatus Cloacimonetes bacterium]|nr:EamA family transporter RarD [Candidatus Cloacimonadota bacterium]MCF7815313.1 EamA family transporter RarD [Candidatus Cloacimonadota bacterium]MCF7869427.1 EamA family transporter RarD [Candidatus Cloacimonadota bacterium]MCF7884826.1 EamA family transporter RarD [Candidatus Cloacimonadota bacterium]